MSQVPPSLGVSGLLLPALIGAAYFSRCLGQAVFFDQRQTVRALGGLTLALSFYAGMLQLLLYANWVRLPVLLSLFVASLLASHLLARRRVVAPNA
ncbi:MAG: hypothetical protein ABIQ16_04265, partial [Polyangiaceae bacterium]